MIKTILISTGAVFVLMIMNSLTDPGWYMAPQFKETALGKLLNRIRGKKND